MTYGQCEQYGKPSILRVLKTIAEKFQRKSGFINVMFDLPAEESEEEM